MLQSLRLRTWLLLLLTTGFTLVVCALIYYQSAQSTIKRSMLANASNTARTGADSLAVRVDTLLQQAAALSDRLSVPADDWKGYLGKLRNEFWIQTTFAELGYGDRDGHLTLTDGRVANIKNDETFKLALQGVKIAGYSAQGEAEVDRSVYAMAPIYDRYRFVQGVLWGAVPVSRIVDGLTPAEIFPEDNGRLSQLYVLLDAGGNEIYASGEASKLSVNASRAVVRSLGDRSESTIDREGSKLFAAKVPGTGWSLVLVIPTDKLYEPLRHLLLRTIVICCLMELLLSLLLLLLISPPFKRIREILRTTESVAAGNFHPEPLKPALNDEIGALAVSVNGMVEQLKNLFEPLQAVTKQNDYGIIVTDADYVVTRFNETAQQLLGYAEEEVVGKATPMAFSSMEELELKAKRLSGKLGRTVRPGLDYLRAAFGSNLSYSEERIYVRKDRTPIPVFLNVSKIVDHSGSVTGYVGLFRDISRQRQIQAELTLAKQIAEDASAAKSVFLARMSHEIRTPINGIIGLAQLVQRTELSEAQQDYMQKIKTSSEVLLGIVNDILDFSKIEAGKFDLESVSFDPEELFAKLGDTLSIFLSKKQLEMIFDIQDGVPARLLGDPLRLEQILLNLTNNAIKFTNRGSVHFRVQVLERDEDQVTLEFSVADTGIGISAEQMAHLFQPFSQADGSTSRKYGGTGLGLVIAGELVTLMGGRLEAESEPGKGSRFYFSLSFPIARPDPAALAVREDADASGISILCIESPGPLREALLGMLASFRAEVVFADGWKEAIGLLRAPGMQASFDYVLCDMELPDMYGEETWLELLAAAGSARTIAMTTPFGQSEWQRMKRSDRPYRTLIKPISRRSIRHLLLGLGQAGDQGRSAEEARRRPKRRSDQPRILLAEDHKINQQVACELLRSQGYETGVAESGVMALEMLKAEHWDLVLMDLHMPEMDGYEATRRIRLDKTGWQLPVIAMTANVIAEDRARCFQAGMNDVVTKPVQAEILFAVVERWLLHASLIDWDEALERVNGKGTILMHMLETFASEYGYFLDRLLGRLREGADEETLRMLHTFKGVSGNLSASAVFAAASELEKAVREAGSADEDRWLGPFERLRRSLEQLLRAIEFERNRHNNHYIT